MKPAPRRDARIFQHSWRISLILILFTSPPLLAQPTTVGPIRVHASRLPGDTMCHGYAEYRFLLENTADKSHRVTIDSEEDSRFARFSGLTTLQSNRRTINLEPRASATLTLLQPPMPTQKEFAVSVDGAEPQGILSFHAVQVDEYTSDSSLEVLVGRGLPTGAMADETQKSAIVINTNFIRAETPISTWSNNWLAYTRFDGVLLTDEDVTKAPPAVWEAICRYVEVGGILTIVGDAPVPAYWEREMVASAKAEPTTNPKGNPAPPGPASGVSGKKTPAREGASGEFTTYRALFGKCMVLHRTPDPTTWSIGTWQELFANWRSTQRSVATIDPRRMNQQLQVTPKQSISTRTVLFLLTFYVILVGPVNLLVLNSIKRKIWVFWTVPAISFAICMGIIAALVMREGIRATMNVSTFTVLYQGRAATLGVAGYYSPMTVSEGLNFSYDTELHPIGMSRSHESSDYSSELSIVWDKNQHLLGGWLPARTAHFFLTRSSETRRERVNLRREPDGSLSALNGLGATITELRVRDRDGVIHEAAQIAAGERKTLKKTTYVINESFRLRQVFTNQWKEAPKNLGDGLVFQLPPGSYHATLDDSPFLPDAISWIGQRTARATVLGFLEEESQ